MNINDLFPSKYLKHTDVPDDGDLILTIREFTVEEIGQGDDREKKGVLYFGETDKGLVLNKTNATAIESLYGADTTGWVMKPIALFATEVDFKGKPTLGLRVRLKAPKANKVLAGTSAGASGGMFDPDKDD